MPAKALSATLLLLVLCVFAVSAKDPAEVPLSDATQECLDCHAVATPGIVQDWKRSSHSRITPAQAIKRQPLQSRFSAEQPPMGLAKVVVGCAECHHGGSSHADSFDHNGRRVHVVVSPADCARCHPQEEKQFQKGMMAHAWGNLEKNSEYQKLSRSINGLPDGSGGFRPADDKTKAESCLVCHGTEVKVIGKHMVKSELGDQELPLLSGWPNRGVGRVNPDGSKGSCGACHSRHSFSIAMARQPSACAQCHKGPDVPAYKVYQVSKHGSLFSGMKQSYRLDQVPWVPGRDFATPTCAACHMSLICNADGVVTVNRSHQLSDRLSWRLFGLPYAHPHPVSPDTTIIRNKEGLPLPTCLDGTFADQFLKNYSQRTQGRAKMVKVCRACHATSWVNQQFARLDRTVETTNQLTLAGSMLLSRAAKKGLANPKDGRYNQDFERKWVALWLFYANSTRYASAMMGADYGVFANGRWYMRKTLEEMRQKLADAKGK